MPHFSSRKISRIFAVALVGLSMGFGLSLSTPAGAKSKGSGSSAVAVEAACKRTAGCQYIGNPGGHMTGCSPNACFDCNKGVCHPLVKKGPTGPTAPGVGNSAGTTTASASANATGQKNERGSGHSGGMKH